MSSSSSYVANLDSRSWMLFVDGENFTIRAQAVVSQLQSTPFALNPGDESYFERDCFVWLRGYHAKQRIVDGRPPLHNNAVRSSYYTSVHGDDLKLVSIKDRLWNIGFSPEVFKKANKEQKAKGVDIALTKDMLSHAFLNNYNTAVLVAGDGDYVPLIEEVKRLGKCVTVAFFAREGLSPELKRSADEFYDITYAFLSSWNVAYGASITS